MRTRRVFFTAVALILSTVLASAQAVYQPKYKGDPARSDSEAVAIAYLKTFLRAQHAYKKKNQHFATSLLELRKTGSFTPRMANPNRGDYTVKFKANKEKDTFEITMAPKQIATDHRSFYSDNEGKIRADEQNEANEGSPLLKAE
jgi:opacity protein-like surface antigen